MESLNLTTPQFLKNHLKENRQNYHFDLLANRRRGDKYVVSKDKKLIPMGLIDRFLCYVSKDYREKIQSNVKKVINKYTSTIDTKDIGDGPTQHITDLFLDKMATMSRKVYGRHFQSSLEKTLFQAIEDRHPQDFQKTANKTAYLWARLGNYESTSEGFSGSYFIFDGSDWAKDKNTIGIFKPSDEDAMHVNNPQLVNHIKRFFYRFPFRPLTGSILLTTSGQSYLAEGAAKIVEKYLVAGVNDYLEKNSNAPQKEILQDLSLVPPTSVETFHMPTRGTQDKIGSFQQWINDPRSTAADFFGVTKKYHGEINQPIIDQNDNRQNDNRSTLQTLFDLGVIIFGEVTGETDRHGFNWFVIFEDEEKTKISKIGLIDNGRAFAPTHPKVYELVHSNSQHIWQTLPFAQGDFDDVSKHVIEHFYQNSHNLHAEIVDFFEKHGDDYADDRAYRMLERINVLHALKDAPKMELTEVNTPTAIMETIQKHFPVKPWFARVVKEIRKIPHRFN